MIDLERGFEAYRTGTNDIGAANLLGVGVTAARRFRLRNGIPPTGTLLARLKVLAAVATAPFEPTLAEVAQLTGVSERTMRRMVKDGRYIQAKRDEYKGRLTLFLTEDGQEEVLR